MVNDQLIGFIQRQLARGVKPERIREALAQSGWSPSDIEEGLTKANPAPVPAPLSAVPTTAPAQVITPTQPIATIPTQATMPSASPSIGAPASTPGAFVAAPTVTPAQPTAAYVQPVAPVVASPVTPPVSTMPQVSPVVSSVAPKKSNVLVVVGIVASILVIGASIYFVYTRMIARRNVIDAQPNVPPTTVATGTDTGASVASDTMAIPQPVAPATNTASTAPDLSGTAPATPENVVPTPATTTTAATPAVAPTSTVSVAPLTPTVTYPDAESVRKAYAAALRSGDVNAIVLLVVPSTQDQARQSISGQPASVFAAAAAQISTAKVTAKSSTSVTYTTYDAGKKSGTFTIVKVGNSWYVQM